MERLILTSSNAGKTDLDIFGGSGSTGVACKLHEREFIGCEIDESYYKQSLERIKNTVPVVKLDTTACNPLENALS
jgi:site-specific DNA-methyltransferase (adenine-specific)